MNQAVLRRLESRTASRIARGQVGLPKGREISIQVPAFPHAGTYANRFPPLVSDEHVSWAKGWEP
jgi:hypothetical protein